MYDNVVKSTILLLKNQIKIKKKNQQKKQIRPLLTLILKLAALDCNNCINSIKLSLAVILVTIHVYIVKGSIEIDKWFNVWNC